MTAHTIPYPHPFWSEPVTERDKELEPDMPCEVGEVPDPERFRAAGYTLEPRRDPRIGPEYADGMVVVHLEEGVTFAAWYGLEDGPALPASEPDANDDGQDAQQDDGNTD